MMAHTDSKKARRYSLDQAARLSRLSRRGVAPLECPECGTPCDMVVDSGLEAKLVMLECPTCHLGVVLEELQQH